MSEIVKGFKAFNQNLQCRGMQYEIGKEYTMDENPIPCQRGYHFCKSVADCYDFYDMSENTRICEIEAFGEIKWLSQNKAKNFICLKATSIE